MMMELWMKRLIQVGLLGVVLLVSPTTWAQKKGGKSAVGVAPQGQSSFSFSPGASWSNAPKEYLVQPGDTLWDISRRFLGSPWFWPKLWSKNPHIQNPHWIFPGNRIRFRNSGEVEPVPKEKKRKELGDLTVGSINSKVRGGITFAGGGLRYPGLQNKNLWERRDSFIDKKSLKRSGIILGAAEGKTLLTEGDAVYIRFKNLQNVTVGEKYSIFRVLRDVRDPRTKRKVGYVIRLQGVMEISERKKRVAVGRIKRAFREIEAGYYVGPYTPHRVKIRVQRNEALVKGYVLRATASVSLVGQFFQIFVNKGRRDGVRLGNTFDLYRKGGAVRGDFANPNLRGVNVRQKIGTAVVIDVRHKTCVAVVTQSAVEIQSGDLAETSLVN